MNLRHKWLLAVIAFLMATTLGVAVAAHGTIIPIFLDSGVDVPADEECLTFEETGGDIFEWQACGGTFYQTVQDEGVSLTQRATIDFAGAGVACVDSGGVKTLCTIAGGGGGGTPGGSDTQVQFNDSGAFGGDAELTYDKTTDILSVNNIYSLPDTTLNIFTTTVTVDGASGPDIFARAGDGAISEEDAGGFGGDLTGLAGNGGVGIGGQDSGEGGEINYVAGNGGASDNEDEAEAGNGGEVFFFAGDGGASSGTGTGGDGGLTSLIGGDGGDSIDGNGGPGGTAELRAGNGGNSTNADDGDGGITFIQSGFAGSTSSGEDGFISIVGDTYFNTQSGTPRNAYQDVDEEVTTTTLTDSAQLVTTLTKARQYKFKIIVFSLNDGATEGIKLSLGGTATAASLKAQVYIYDDTLNTLVAFARITSLGGAGVGAGLSAGTGFSIIEGTIDVTDGGTLLLQFAQNATGASSGVHVEVNSSIESIAIRPN